MTPINGHPDHLDDKGQEKALLKYFSIIIAVIIVILGIISRWLPSIDLPLRAGVLTATSFGTTMIIERKELKRPTTLVVLVVGVLVHLIALWAIRDYLAAANMWVVGVGAFIECLLLLILIELSKPANERWE
ncbi:hypothetical protein [Alloacidobacterium sp.]|uniref:hypothetical protein n=1 Tax=Alloacidobacterium sp. TaxID=2951999 RepID=UPI002D2BDD0D|nr:hypothetical protein [Alloacidobacterium sp.]HYK35509.1 hypothetical protein [Alloacidobacterium sp.]